MVIVSSEFVHANYVMTNFNILNRTIMTKGRKYATGVVKLAYSLSKLTTLVPNIFRIKFCAICFKSHPFFSFSLPINVSSLPKYFLFHVFNFLLALASHLKFN